MVQYKYDSIQKNYQFITETICIPTIVRDTSNKKENMESFLFILHREILRMKYVLI